MFKLEVKKSLIMKKNPKLSPPPHPHIKWSAPNITASLRPSGIACRMFVSSLVIFGPTNHNK